MRRMKKVCIVGASGKLGQYMVQHALDRGYEVVGVCREQSVAKLDAFKGRITVIPGATDDREVIKRAVAGCDGVLTVLTPRGVHGYSTGTAQAVLDHAPPGARLVFSCGWHITRDGQDVYSRRLKAIVAIFGPIARLARFADLDDEVEACRRVFAERLDRSPGALNGTGVALSAIEVREQASRSSKGVRPMTNTSREPGHHPPRSDERGHCWVLRGTQ